MREKYYCNKCNRYHYKSRGKIYYEHLESANTGRRKSKNLPYESLDAGDFILIKNRRTLLIGKYNHVVMYCGKVESRERRWDRDKKEYMKAGTPYVIHSTPKTGNGLGYSSFYTIIKKVRSALPLEVKGLSKSEKKQCIDFLRKQMDGISGRNPSPKYDIFWFTKQKEPKKHKGFYCSEAIWSAYMSCHEINLDPNGFSWTTLRGHGITPDDLMKSKHTRIIT